MDPQVENQREELLIWILLTSRTDIFGTANNLKLSSGDINGIDDVPAEIKKIPRTQISDGQLVIMVQKACIDNGPSGAAFAAIRKEFPTVCENGWPGGAGGRAGNGHPGVGEFGAIFAAAPAAPPPE